MSALIKHRIAGRRAVDSDYLVENRLVRRLASETDGETVSPEEQAKRIIDDARQEAAGVVAEARLEAENIRLDAYRTGEQAAQSELDEAMLALDKARADMDEEASRQVQMFWRSVEPELLKLSVEIARKIVRREIEKNDEFILEAIKAGLHQLSSRHDLKIRVNSADSGMVKERKDDLTASFDGMSQIEVIEDRRVPRGGWIVESSSGRLDGRVDSQLKEVERSLTETLRDAKS
jgi:flagellar assembly protein FliH